MRAMIIVVVGTLAALMSDRPLHAVIEQFVQVSLNDAFGNRVDFGRSL
jgi:hypothetical protein